MHPKLHVLDHPLLQHKLGQLRDVTTTTDHFRRLVREISAMMAYELTRELPVTTVKVRTPMGESLAPMITAKSPCIVAVLRAGSGMVDGMLEFMPGAPVGHIGLYRDPETLDSIEYYFKLPPDIDERDVIIVDPMLATGNSASAAIARVREEGGQRIKFACIVAAPEGLRVVAQAHPDVPVYTVAVDSHLDERGYIVPGIGDAGNRIFGTR
jgi:uracil phosphoribosyltransferase